MIAAPTPSPDTVVEPDPTRCPHCEAALTPGAPTCSSCDLLVTGEDAARLWWLTTQRVELHREALVLTARLLEQGRALVQARRTPQVQQAPQAPAAASTFSTPHAGPATTAGFVPPTYPNVPASSGSPAAHDNIRLRRRVSGQHLALALGAALLLTGVGLFLHFVWDLIGLGGQATVMTALTLGAATASAASLRHRLTATAQTFAVVAVGLLTLDVWAMHHLNLFGLGKTDPALFTGIAGLGAVGVLAAFAVVPHLIGVPAATRRTVVAYAPAIAAAAVASLVGWIDLVDPTDSLPRVALAFGTATLTLAAAAVVDARHRAVHPALAAPRPARAPHPVAALVRLRHALILTPLLGFAGVAILAGLSDALFVISQADTPREFAATAGVTACTLIFLGLLAATAHPAAPTPLAAPATLRKPVRVAVGIGLFLLLGTYLLALLTSDYASTMAFVVAVAAAAWVLVRSFAPGLLGDRSSVNVITVLAHVAMPAMALLLHNLHHWHNASVSYADPGAGVTIAAFVLWVLACAAHTWRLRTAAMVAVTHNACFWSLVVPSTLVSSAFQYGAIVGAVAVFGVVTGLLVMRPVLAGPTPTGVLHAAFLAFTPLAVLAYGVAGLIVCAATETFDLDHVSGLLLAVACYGFIHATGTRSLLAAHAATLTAAGSYWAALIDADVSVVEAYTLPVAVVLALVGAWQWAVLGERRSNRVMGPSLWAGFAPTLGWVMFTDDTLRLAILVTAAVLAFLLGVQLEFKAPVLIATIVLVLVMISNGGLLFAHLSGWAVLAGAGAVLLAVGTMWERAVLTGKRTKDWYRSLT